MTMSTQPHVPVARGRALTVFAILFALLAVSNFLKPLQLGGERTGFVFLGQRLTETANTIVGPLFGLYLLAYAVSIWRMKRIALTMGWAYAAYVVVNLLLFNLRTSRPPAPGTSSSGSSTSSLPSACRAARRGRSRNGRTRSAKTPACASAPQPSRRGAPS